MKTPEQEMSDILKLQSEIYKGITRFRNMRFFNRYTEVQIQGLIERNQDAMFDFSGFYNDLILHNQAAREKLHLNDRQVTVWLTILDLLIRNKLKKDEEFTPEMITSIGNENSVEKDMILYGFTYKNSLRVSTRLNKKLDLIGNYLFLSRLDKSLLQHVQLIIDEKGVAHKRTSFDELVQYLSGLKTTNNSVDDIDGKLFTDPDNDIEHTTVATFLMVRNVNKDKPISFSINGDTTEGSSDRIIFHLIDPKDDFRANVSNIYSRVPEKDVLVTPHGDDFVVNHSETVTVNGVNYLYEDETTYVYCGMYEINGKKYKIYGENYGDKKSNIVEINDDM